MAINVYPTDEQNMAAGEIIARVTGVPLEKIAVDGWTIEHLRGDHCLLKIEVVQFISKDVAAELLAAFGIEVR